MTRKYLIALAAMLAATSAAYAADEYPRLATYAIGGPQEYYKPDYQKKLAKVNVSVLAIFPGWGASQKTTMDATVKQIKALNPSTKVFAYIIGEAMQVPASSSWVEYEAKVNASDWWLYTTGLDTSKVLSDYGKDFYVLNISTQAKKDGNGQVFAQWFGNYAASEFGNPNPTLDGMFTDNVFWKPRRDGDWNLDGKIDSQNDAAVQGWYRAGYRLYLDTLKKAMPGKLQLANVADWGQPNAVLTEYKGAFNGGVLEHIIGSSWSVENQGWAVMMAQYRKTMDALAAPKYGIFEQFGSVTDYQGMRYGLASTLMDEGYYSFNDSSHQNYGVPWFDEFDAKLGAAVSKPQTAAWQAGVYRRDFEKGIVLVNPKGNGQREVTLDADFVKIKGTQDATVNDGSTVRKVTLKDRDGIILLRAKPVKRPAPPGSITTTAGD
ncbi:MAG: putative glycoside hydrolase [Gammaproteobacteria bacterium]